MEMILSIKLLIFVLAMIYLHSHLGVIEGISNYIASLIFRRKVTLGKPFSCLQCTVFWSTWVYSLILGISILNSAYIGLFFTFIAPFLSNLITFIYRGLDAIIERLFNLLE